MLDKDWEYFGAGYAKNYWVQAFGRKN